MRSIRTRPETLPVGVLLAAVGGFLDGFTFIGYGGVFGIGGELITTPRPGGRRHS